MKVRFLGSEPGLYDIQVFVDTTNIIDGFSGPQNLDVNSYIDSISPSTGSVYGGTKITIIGGPFSDNGLENNVPINEPGASGDT